MPVDGYTGGWLYLWLITQVVGYACGWLHKWLAMTVDDYTLDHATSCGGGIKRVVVISHVMMSHGRLIWN